MGTFETNSSSTHSICIPRNEQIKLPLFVDFETGEFGWEIGEADPKSYLFTAIMIQSEPKRGEMLNHLMHTLESNGVKCKFHFPKVSKSSYTGYEYLDECYIDHGCELDDFLRIIMEDDDLLLRYLFCDTKVYTGNDNTWYVDDDDVPHCYIAETHYNDKRSDDYDYFFKGN